MPSFFTKLLAPSSSLPSKNPYSNPQHPSHPQTSLTPPQSTTAPRTFSSHQPQSQPQPQPQPRPQPQTSNWNDIPDDMFAPAARPKSRRAYPSQSQSQSQSQAQGQGRPASPRGDQRDFLAEAREAVGRHPVTGRVQHGGAEGNHGSEENSVYQETNGERIRAGAQASGTKYDLFVQEMKARKGGRWRAPDGGFYAPERRVGEFYQPRGMGAGRE